MPRAKTISRTAASLTFALLAAAGGVTGCEQRSEAAAAIERAQSELSSVGAGEAEAGSYRAVIAELTPFASEGTATEKAAAAALLARARIGLASPMVSTVLKAEGRALNSLNVARSQLGQWIELSASAAAYEAFDPTEDLAAMRADMADRRAELDQAQALKTELEQDLLALQDRIDAKIAEARDKRVREGELTLRLAQVSATEAAQLAEQARAVGREADAIEFEAAEIEAQSAEIRPRLLEAELDVSRLEGQIATIEAATDEVEAAAAQAEADAAAAATAAAAAAERFDGIIASIVELRQEEIDGPTSEAQELLERAASDAARARSGLREQSAIVRTHAQQWLATLLSARAAGLEALTLQLDRAVNAEPPAPNATRYAAMLSERSEELDGARTALEEVLAEAQSGAESMNFREPAPIVDAEPDENEPEEALSDQGEDNGGLAEDSMEESGDESSEQSGGEG